MTDPSGLSASDTLAITVTPVGNPLPPACTAELKRIPGGLKKPKKAFKIKGRKGGPLKLTKSKKQPVISFTSTTARAFTITLSSVGRKGKLTRLKAGAYSFDIQPATQSDACKNEVGGAVRFRLK